MCINNYGIYVPIINKDICTRCGLCMRVCPGYGFDYAKFYSRIHGSLPNHIALGKYLNIYSGHSNDQEILHRSQSGGFVSTLLLYCIEKNLADGAIVTRWRQDSPLKPHTYIARTREEVLAATGSKYNPVPTAQIIRTLLNEPGRFVFVGTSCHIHAMRKAEKEFPKLSEKVVLYVGLHCLGVFTYHFHNQILHKIKLKHDDLVYFRHRDKASGGWPCGMRIKGDKGQIFDLDAKNSRLWPRPYFTNWRCQLCFDKTNEFSDVSCGDCRISEEHRYFEDSGYNLRQGLSEFVIRTERAQQVISKILKEGRLIVHKTEADPISISIGVSGKKLGLNTFRIVARLLGCGVPEYGVRFEHPGINTSWKNRLLRIWTIVSSIRYYFFFAMSRYSVARWILKRIPHQVMGKMDAKINKRVEWARYGWIPKVNAIITRDDQDNPTDSAG